MVSDFLTGTLVSLVANPPNDRLTMMTDRSNEVVLSDEAVAFYVIDLQ